MSYTAQSWRDAIWEITGQYRDTPGDAPPPQVIEAMVNLETGGTFDPSIVHPSSGAIGLGQVMKTGMEYGAFVNDPAMKAKYPNGPDLFDGYQNLEVMVYGMNMRQELGGALSDWFMASASYLGGADTSGFNTSVDAQGTSGRAYAQQVMRYVHDTWSMHTLRHIDNLQPGAVMNYLADNPAEIWFDPDQRTADPFSFDNKKTPEESAEEIYKGVTLFKRTEAGAVWDILKDPSGFMSGVADAFMTLIGSALPRVGLFAVGVVILLVGLWAAKGAIA